MRLFAAIDDAVKSLGAWIDLGDGFALGAIKDMRGLWHFTMRMNDGRLARYGVYRTPTESYEAWWLSDGAKASP